MTSPSLSPPFPSRPASIPARLRIAALAASALLSTPLLAVAPATAFTEEVAAPGLPGPVAVRVLLPPSYEGSPGRRFPVLYFLHDSGGDERVLERRGVAATLAERMRAGSLPEMLVVSPRGEKSWFTNSWDGRVPYGDFLDRSLVPWVDGRFRTVAAREGRVVAGISMGGYGALRWGLLNPGLFAAVGGLSAAAQQMSWRGARELPFFVRPQLDAVFGEEPRTNVYVERDLYQALLSRPSLSQGAPAVVLRCGTSDHYRLDTVATFLSKFLAATGIECEVRLEPGGHDWGYWERSFPATVEALARRLGTGTGGRG